MRIAVAFLCLFAAVPGGAAGVKTGRTVSSPISPAAAVLVQGAFKSYDRPPSGLLSSLRSLDLSGTPSSRASFAPFLNILAGRAAAFPHDVPGSWLELPEDFSELAPSEQADVAAVALANLPPGRRDIVIEGILKETARQSEQTALRYVEAAEAFLYDKGPALHRLLGPMRLYIHNLDAMDRTLGIYLTEPTRRRLQEARVVAQKAYLKFTQADISEKIQNEAKRSLGRDADLLAALAAAADDDAAGGQAGELTPKMREELDREEPPSATVSAATSLALIKSLARHGLNGDPDARRLALKTIADLSSRAGPRVKNAAAKELDKARRLAAGESLGRAALKVLAPVESFLRAHSRWAIYAFGLGAVLFSRSAAPSLFGQVVFIAAAALAIAALWKAARRA